MDRDCEVSLGIREFRKYGRSSQSEDAKELLKDVSGLNFSTSKESDNFTTGLMEFRKPENVQEIQRFIFACNWMKSSIPDFSNKSYV